MLGTQTVIMLSVLLGSVVLYINFLITRELIRWEPSHAKKIFYLLLVWLIPVIGAAVAYRSLGLSWFKKKQGDQGGAESTVSGAFLEMDALFNPGQRHVMEERQKEQSELSESGKSIDKAGSSASVLDQK